MDPFELLYLILSTNIWELFSSKTSKILRGKTQKVTGQLDKGISNRNLISSIVLYFSYLNNKR